MKYFVIHLLVLILSLDLIQAQKVIVDSPILQNVKTRHRFIVDSIVMASNHAIIVKLGKENFHQWADSVIVRGKYAPRRPYFDRYPGDSLNYAYFQEQVYQYKYYFNYHLIYYFTIPDFGHYTFYLTAHLVDQHNNVIKIDDPFLPDCIKYVDKCHFIKKTKALAIVKKKLGIKDLSLLLYKFRTTVHDTCTSQYQTYNDNIKGFAIFSWEFGTANAHLVLNANNGKVLKYIYYPPKENKKPVPNK